MSSEQTSFGIEDLLNTEDEANEFASPSTILETGAEGNFEPEAEIDAIADPNATRWMFNPYAYIDLTNLPAGCGFPYLRNIVFNRVRTLTFHMGKDVMQTSQAIPGGSHNPANYQQYSRTAYMIANELENKYGDKGVVMISELTGLENAAEMNKLLFGSDGIQAKEDVNAEGHPIPVLPNVLEQLQINATKAIAEAADEDKPVIQAVARRVRDAIRLGIRHARLVIDEAQKRFLDEKNPNRYFSAAERRAFLALGEEVPSQLPLVTRSAAASASGAGMSGNDIAQAVTAGVVAAMGSKPQGQVAEAPVQTLPDDFVDVSKAADLEKKAADMNFGDETKKADTKPKAKTPSTKIATGE
jgi:hypothetical protein